jgi:hypothetical protein
MPRFGATPGNPLSTLGKAQRYSATQNFAQKLKFKLKFNDRIGGEL